MEMLGEATAGGLGSVVSVGLLFPVNKVKTRMQAESRVSGVAPSFVQSFKDLIEKEGWDKLFTGLRAALSKAFVNNFIFYYAFSALRKLYFKNTKNSLLRSMLHGICAGLCVQVIMSPWDTILTRMLTYKGPAKGKAAAGGKDNGGTFFQTARDIIAEQGMGGFYAGLVPMLMLTINPGISTTVRNKLTSQFARATTARENFWIGAISKCCASTITYPLVIAKVALQIRKRARSISVDLSNEVARRREMSTDKLAESVTEQDHGKISTHTEVHEVAINKKPTVLNTLVRIARSEGVGSGLYKGCGVHISQAVAKEAILNMVRHEIYKVVMSVFLGTPAVATE